MVTVNLWALIAVAAVAMIACGFIGIGFGVQLGYYKGYLAAMNHDALCGLRKTEPTEPPGGGSNA